MRQLFTVYRWNNPQTSSDYPFLAVAPGTEGQSMLLMLGNYGLAFDWGIPDEAAELLATDFQPTGQQIIVNLIEVQAALDETFIRGSESGSVTFDATLSPCRLEVVLGEAEDGGDLHADARAPEYLIEGFGSYLRCLADQRCVPVTMIERAMLDTCISTFAELAGQWAALITEPPPPRYRAGAAPAEAAAAGRTDS